MPWKRDKRTSILCPVITSITTEKTYVMSSTTLSKLQRVPLREVWKHEAAEFTPWLAEQDNLDTLAEVLGLSELVLEATEHSVGDFKLDILCTDGDDQIIIENQVDSEDMVTCSEFNIHSFPTLDIVSDGSTIRRISGYCPAEDIRNKLAYLFES